MRNDATVAGGDDFGTTSSPANSRTAEFDAFGPWVDEVRNAEDVPRLYRDHPIDFDTTRLVLKVPRDIERRLANPGMHLYDHLLIVDRHTLTALSRRTDDTYRVETVPLTSIAAVTLAVNLLDGRFVITPADSSPIDVRFSGAAREAMDGLVALLRAEGWHRADVPVGPIRGGTPIADVRLGGVDEILGNDCRADLAASGAYRVLAAFERRAVKSKRTGLRKLIDLLRPLALQGAVLATDGVELRIFGRIAPLRRRSLAEYSDRRVSVSIAAITGVEVAANRDVVDVNDVTIRLGGGSIEVSVPGGSEAERALVALAR
ncbi:hypothetical protein GCM10010401_11050 [Rarobacter faecitabidus]|uniref:Uncharacterized protein n=1 Tax=Rarobacter faecitabidus TaxID=13243 RepID=A0A542ZP73_RARFA|nr:hypothetical protein [Rarobacter faecitabidus]TQL62152.1 hypothetical protein FB461_1790 [Rarobacter faecitabidus]